MKKLRLISIICALVMIFSCFAAFPATAAGPSWATQGGDGSKDNPYILNDNNFLNFYDATKGLTAEDGYLSSSSVYIKLEDDIVLNDGWTASSTAPTADTVNSGVTPREWTSPIGGTQKIRAHFDGGNHTISGIYMKSSSTRVSLFGVIVGSVSNLKVINSYFENTNTSGYVDAATFASRLTMGTIENCYSDAILKANSTNSDAGGIVGMVDWGTTSIKNCVFTGRIESSGSAGGILGKINWDGSNNLVANVSDCLNLGSVKTSGNFAGGIVGNENTNEVVNISNCINANPNIENTATATSIGDIVGSAYSTNNTVANTYVVNGLRNSRNLVAKEKTATDCSDWDISEIYINDLLNEQTMKSKGFTNWTYDAGYLPVPTSTNLNVRIDDDYVLENVNLGLSFDGASVRIDDIPGTGIRFITNVDVDVINALKNAGATVAFGTYITKADFVIGENAIDFTPAALNAQGKVCLDVSATEFFGGKQIAGTIANVTDFEFEYASRAYVNITFGEKTYTFLAEFVEGNIRSVSDVATAAIADPDGGYTDAQIQKLTTLLANSAE